MKNTISFNNIKYVLTDIEGTTTSISFVHDVLFPYAYEKLPAFIEKAGPEVLELISSLENPVEQLRAWINADKKEPVLKTIQGMIWKDGYLSGELKGHIYPEVKDCLLSWTGLGKKIGIYSSGSVAAQKLLFGYSLEGDLTPLFSNYFDTAVGHKREAISYGNILKELKIKAENVLFLSDVKEELDAARSVGLQTCQLVRDDKVVLGDHEKVENFELIKI